ncbi:ABC transporter permease [Actinomadura chibensis]|uniref:ABC transporter permease subunit n=1 Tax=Actinomadura chibensis TaxID=392828 RepID=A0A5D0NTZ9_9ACTN|nr:ABC transporter permease subunit [Actinomadura chibensis]TYB47837.1 ABC transporter permease subunit [Actinomadura chibensis]
MTGRAARWRGPGARVSALRVAAGAALVACWQAASYSDVLVLGTGRPSELAGVVRGWFDGPAMAEAVGSTLCSAAAGLAVGVVGALALLLLTANRYTMRLSMPLVAAANAVPKIVLAPLFILWFGIGRLTAVAFVATLVGFIVFYNLNAGVRSIDPLLRRQVAAWGGGRRWILGEVTVPAVMGWLIASLRVSAAFALLAAVVVEYLGSETGIGYQISQAQSAQSASAVMAMSILVGVLGLGVDRAILWLERRLLSWRAA